MPTPPQKKVTFPIKILDFLLVFLVYILEGGMGERGGTPPRDPSRDPPRARDRTKNPVFGGRSAGGLASGYRRAQKSIAWCIKIGYFL